MVLFKLNCLYPEHKYRRERSEECEIHLYALDKHAGTPSSPTSFRISFSVRGRFFFLDGENQTAEEEKTMLIVIPFHRGIM